MAKKPSWIVRDGLVLRIGSRTWRWWKTNVKRLHGLVAHKVARKVVMYDSIYPQNIPTGAKAVLGYVGGKWPTYTDGSLARLFPKALKLSCAVAASLDANCLDIERYDATPEQAPGWVKRQHARGVKRPVLYTSASCFQPLVDRMTKAGERYGKDYAVVTAHYDPTKGKHVCGPKCGFGIKQYAHGTQWTNKAPGRNNSRVDESLVLRKIFN